MTQPTTHLKPGDKMPDGTAYAGISHQQDGDASPADVPLTMTSPLEFYGTTIIDDPIMGPRPFAFIKRVEDKGVSRWPMTAEYVAHLKDIFSAASADDDYARASLAAVAAAEKALTSEGNRRGLGASPFVFPDDHVFIQCDGYRTVPDPDLGPRVFAMLRQRFPTDGFVVRRPATAEELQGIADHFREHALGSETDNHGMSKSEFRKAAEFVDDILAEVKARKPTP